MQASGLHTHVPAHTYMHEHMYEQIHAMPLPPHGEIDFFLIEKCVGGPPFKCILPQLPSRKKKGTFY